MQGQVQEQMRLNKLSQEQVLKEIFLKQQNIKKLTQTSQISDMVLYLASESSSTITGEALNISGGWGMGL
jgi:3-hydroxybutyrate dehydrogenase